MGVSDIYPNDRQLQSDVLGNCKRMCSYNMVCLEPIILALWAAALVIKSSKSLTKGFKSYIARTGSCNQAYGMPQKLCSCNLVCLNITIGHGMIQISTCAMVTSAAAMMSSNFRDQFNSQETNPIYKQLQSSISQTCICTMVHVQDELQHYTLELFSTEKHRQYVVHY